MMPRSSALRAAKYVVALCTTSLCAVVLAGCSAQSQSPSPSPSQSPSDAPAGSAPPVDYVAFGDSYASGFGAGSYTDECGRSPLGLPTLLGSREDVDLVGDATCAGARAASASGGPVDLPEQVAGAVDAGWLSPDTALVTISAGGNDAGFAEVAGICATRPPAACAQVIEDQNTSVFPVLAQDLDVLYGAIRSAAPDAAVLVTGYPHLFSPESGSALLPQESQEAFNAGTDALNDVIRRATEAHGFSFVDLVGPFTGHGLGSPESWITYREGADDNLHPTAEGYASGYLPAVLATYGEAASDR